MDDESDELRLNGGNFVTTLESDDREPVARGAGQALLRTRKALLLFRGKTLFRLPVPYNNERVPALEPGPLDLRATGTSVQY